MYHYTGIYRPHSMLQLHCSALMLSIMHCSSPDELSPVSSHAVRCVTTATERPVPRTAEEAD